MDAAELEHFHQHGGVGAIAGGDTYDAVQLLFQADAVNAFYPGACVEGKTGAFGFADEALGVRVRYKNIVQVDGRKTRRYQYLDGDGSGYADSFQTKPRFFAVIPTSANIISTL
jgi:hypothetical protein